MKTLEITDAEYELIKKHRKEEEEKRKILDTGIIIGFNTSHKKDDFYETKYTFYKLEDAKIMVIDKKEQFVAGSQYFDFNPEYILSPEYNNKKRKYIDPDDLRKFMFIRDEMATKENITKIINSYVKSFKERHLESIKDSEKYIKATNASIDNLVSASEKFLNENGIKTEK